MNFVALIKLIRLHYTIPLSAGFIVIVLYMMGGDWLAVPTTLPYACLALLFIIAGGYALNDACDIETDRINHPTRVLVQNQLSQNTAIGLASLLFVLGLISASLCTGSFFIGMILVTSGIIFYDLTSKRLGAFKDILVALLATSLYPLAFALVSTPTGLRVRTLWFHPFWFFLVAWAYEILKDIRDIPGDETVGSPSHWLHTRYPWLLWLSLFFLIPPHIVNDCGPVYLSATLLAILTTALTTRLQVLKAIPCLYLTVIIVTLGSLLDLLFANA